MRKSVLVFFLLVFLLGNPSLTLAVNVSASPSGLLKRAQVEVVAKRKEAYQKRLAEMKDAKKKALVDRTNEKMKRVNLRRVEEWKKTLARLTQYLAQVQERATKLKANGKDIAGVEAAVASAKLAIDQASSLVAAQGEKDYTLTLGPETTLKNLVGQAISAEQSDLRNVQQAVDAAKKAVASAVSALRLAGAK